VARDSGRHRLVVLVDDLEHDQVLQDVHARLALAPGGRMSASVVP
jgi:hypothetical protein